MITVCAAIILCNNKVLIAQRKRGKNKEFLWEFPGGKVEPHETLENCLKREIMEEFEKKISVDSFFMETGFDNILLQSFLCSCASQEMPACYDHEQYKWIDLSELKNFDFCPADVPIVERLSLGLEI